MQNTVPENIIADSQPVTEGGILEKLKAQLLAEGGEIEDKRDYVTAEEPEIVTDKANLAAINAAAYELLKDNARTAWGAAFALKEHPAVNALVSRLETMHADVAAFNLSSNARNDMRKLAGLYQKHADELDHANQVLAPHLTHIQYALAAFGLSRIDDDMSKEELAQIEAGRLYMESKPGFSPNMANYVLGEPEYVQQFKQHYYRVELDDGTRVRISSDHLQQFYPLYLDGEVAPADNQASQPVAEESYAKQLVRMHNDVLRGAVEIVWQDRKAEIESTLIKWNKEEKLRYKNNKIKAALGELKLNAAATADLHLGLKLVDTLPAGLQVQYREKILEQVFTDRAQLKTDEDVARNLTGAVTHLDLYNHLGDTRKEPITLSQVLTWGARISDKPELLTPSDLPKMEKPTRLQIWSVAQEQDALRDEWRKMMHFLPKAVDVLTRNQPEPKAEAELLKATVGQMNHLLAKSYDFTNNSRDSLVVYRNRIAEVQDNVQAIANSALEKAAEVQAALKKAEKKNYAEQVIDDLKADLKDLKNIAKIPSVLNRQVGYVLTAQSNQSKAFESAVSPGFVKALKARIKNDSSTLNADEVNTLAGNMLKDICAQPQAFDILDGMKLALRAPEKLGAKMWLKRRAANRQLYTMIAAAEDAYISVPEAMDHVHEKTDEADVLRKLYSEKVSAFTQTLAPMAETGQQYMDVKTRIAAKQQARLEAAQPAPAPQMAEPAPAPAPAPTPIPEVVQEAVPQPAAGRQIPKFLLRPLDAPRVPGNDIPAEVMAARFASPNAKPAQTRDEHIDRVTEAADEAIASGHRKREERLREFDAQTRPLLKILAEDIAKRGRLPQQAEDKAPAVEHHADDIAANTPVPSLTIPDADREMHADLTRDPRQPIERAPLAEQDRPAAPARRKRSAKNVARRSFKKMAAAASKLAVAASSIMPKQANTPVLSGLDLTDVTKDRKTPVAETVAADTADTENAEPQVGQKINNNPLVNFLLGEPDKLKESSRTWQERVAKYYPVGMLRVGTMGAVSYLSLAGASASVGGSVVGIIGTLGLGAAAAPLVGGLIVGGALGYASSKLIKRYYDTRLQEKEFAEQGVEYSYLAARQAIREKRIDEKQQKKQDKRRFKQAKKDRRAAFITNYAWTNQDSSLRAAKNEYRMLRMQETGNEIVAAFGRLPAAAKAFVKSDAAVNALIGVALSFGLRHVMGVSLPAPALPEFSLPEFSLSNPNTDIPTDLPPAGTVAGNIEKSDRLVPKITQADVAAVPGVTLNPNAGVQPGLSVPGISVVDPFTQYGLRGPNGEIIINPIPTAELPAGKVVTPAIVTPEAPVENKLADALAAAQGNTGVVKAFVNNDPVFQKLVTYLEQQRAAGADMSKIDAMLGDAENPKARTIFGGSFTELNDLLNDVAKGRILNENGIGPQIKGFMANPELALEVRKSISDNLKADMFTQDGFRRAFNANTIYQEYETGERKPPQAKAAPLRLTPRF